MSYYLMRTGHNENTLGSFVLKPFLDAGGKVIDQTSKAYILDGISYEAFKDICQRAGVWMALQVEYGEIERGSPDLGLEF